MIHYLQHRLATDREGAIILIRGAIFTTLQHFSLFLPVMLVYLFIDSILRNVQLGIAPGVADFWLYVGLAVVAALAIGVLSMFHYNSTYLAVYSEGMNRRVHLAETLRKLPLSFFAQRNLSDLTSTVMKDAQDLEQIFSHAVPQLIAALVVILVAFVGLLFYSWQLTFALFWVIILALILFWFSKRKMNAIHKAQQGRTLAVTERIEEGIDGANEIKSFNLQQHYLKDLDGDLERYEQGQNKGELHLAVIVGSLTSLLKLGMPTLVLVGTILMANGSLDLLTFLLFIVIASMIFEPIVEVMNQASLLFYLDTRVERTRQIFESSQQQGETGVEVKDYTLEFRHVDFSYEAGVPVLHNVSFTAKQGEITALVGPSGGGKSSAARLAARFWDVTGGSITLGGIDISTIDPEELLQHYSIVFQDVVLFNASLMDNIRIGRRNATDEEVLAAAKLAQCDEFALSLPAGYQTVIGENGSTLSGGERQRLSIARAILKNAPIILLDEATASLDVENETKIQEALSTLVKGKTVLIIAHRMRTVARANRVVVLRGGECVEQGTPAELKAQNGEFAHMVEVQMQTV